MRISKADTDRYVFYVPALSDKFAVFLSDQGQTYEINQAMSLRLSEAYSFRTAWEKENPGKGHLVVIPDDANVESINVIPVGYLDNIVNDFN